MKQKDINDLTESFIREMKVTSRSPEKLHKNQMGMSFYKSGAIEFEFGKGVPDKAKKAALAWAKKRGLKAVEASLNKSATAPDSYLFGNDRQDSEVLASYSWNF